MSDISKSSDAEKDTTGKMSDNNSNDGGDGLPTTSSNNANTETTINFASAPFISSPTNKGLLPAPNSKPREREPAPVETYVYRDFANAEPANLSIESHKRMPPQSLQSQKLPSKLAAMLSDPDLAGIITWMPHGRSWKILNRELFSTFALPRYFGHSNHASFVRIVNAWGFRRISMGVDRDSYFHELFLRSKPQLHARMKRLPSCHRKTPIDKDDKCPDFYELAKTSPLPEVNWSIHNSQPGAGGFLPKPTATLGGGSVFPNLNPASMMNGGAYNMPESIKPIHFGDATGEFASMNGLMGGSGIGSGTNSSYSMMDNNPMLASILGMSNSGNASSLGAAPPTTDMSSLNAYTQTLQRENENLMLKIKILEYENQSRLQKKGQDQHQQLSAIGGASQQNSAYGANL